MNQIKRIHSKCYAVNLKPCGQFDPASDALYFPSLKAARAYLAGKE